MYVYADNAATTKMSPTAIQAMTDAIEQYWGNPSSLHTTGQTAKEALEAARAEIAQLLGAESPREIYFTSGGSEADNQAILSAAQFGARKGKKHIISTKFEHHAVLHTLQKLQKQGYEVELLDVHETGIVTPEQVKNALRPDTALVTVMYANNEIGTVQPIREIGAVCREAGVLFHTDAVQAVCHIPVSVREDNIDMLSLSAHKFHGPKGIGVLYARKGILLRNLIEGGAQERGKRAGTENMPAILSMAVAMREEMAQMDAVTAKLTTMRDRLIEGLTKIPHSRLNGDRNQRVPATVNFCFEGIEGEALLLMLDAEGIQASSGSACTSGSLDPSHVLLALGLPHEVAHGSLRLSIDAETTDDEITHILTVVPRVVSYLRNMSPVWEALENGEKEHLI
ncbi:MAG: cysteine desulfurase NifS [Clostridia bacterium]|nr:cysteine desulfurase NifS [Clostridia bacterium]